MKNLVFMWDNFGPMHMDKTEAVGRHFGPGWQITGIELNGKSADYGWASTLAKDFRKVTLVQPGERAPGMIGMTIRLLRACRASRARHFFFCHYEKPYVFLSAMILRLTGARLYTMSDSKFDDYERQLWREMLKTIFIWPYSGTIAASRRSRDYLRFLGVSRERIAGRYYVISIDRLREMAQAPPAPAGMPHAQRDFICAARFVPKKNLEVTLRAFALYRQRTQSSRRLILCGGGALEPVLRALADELGITDDVVFHGFVQTDEVCRLLARSLALLLLSTEEQFGQVVFEAQAMGVPAIVTDAVGARDELVRSGVNGFLVEPDNVVGTSLFMAMLCRDEALWQSMAAEAAATAPLSDTIEYVHRIAALIDAEIDLPPGTPYHPNDILPAMQMERAQAALARHSAQDNAAPALAKAAPKC